MKKYINNLVKLVATLGIFMFLGCENNDSVEDQVAITQLQPIEQYQGDDAKIVGSGLDKVNYIFVGNFDAKFTYEAGEISFKVPVQAPAGINIVTLVVGDKKRVTTEMTVLIKPIPTISTVTPSAAAAGENVTIYGTNLNNSPSIKVGGVTATVVSSTNTKVVFTVPVVANNLVASQIELKTTFGTATPSSIFYASKNLILNSELELGTGDSFTNWSRVNGATLMVASTAANESYFGRALKATGDGRAEWRTQFSSDRVATTVGAKYLVYMWIKGSTTAGSMRFSTSSTAAAIYGNNIAIGKEWKQVTFAFTANSTSTSIALDMGIKTDVYNVDNITMVAQ